MVDPIDPKAIIRIMLFQSLVGNYDWHLRISPDDSDDSNSLWNVKVIEAGHNRVVFPYDYDLSAWARLDDSPPELPSFDNNFYKRADISRVVAEFKEKRPATEALVNDLANEARSGARSIKEQIKSFYNALDRDFGD